MIYFDPGKAARARHRSGLNRVTRRLAEEWGASATSCELLGAGEKFADAAHAFRPTASDWWLTASLFSEPECPGLWAFIRSRPCRLAAIFHDAIPLKHPHITWPQSVSRHPEYMKMLADFDRVFAVSEASCRELVDFWRWQGVEVKATVETIALGADFNGQPRMAEPIERVPAPALLCVGIVEPRKNQGFLLDVCETLWSKGLAFSLDVVGRANPHFGAPLLAQLESARGRRPYLKYHDAADDETLTRLYRNARATIFPTIAEGCGLPLLESLWMGVPCVCSDLPVLRENADAGGCVAVRTNDRAAWATALERMLTDDAYWRALRAEVTSRVLPTWAETARNVAARLAGG